MSPTGTVRDGSHSLAERGQASGPPLSLPHTGKPGVEAATCIRVDWHNWDIPPPPSLYVFFWNQPLAEGVWLQVIDWQRFRYEDIPAFLLGFVISSLMIGMD